MYVYVYIYIYIYINTIVRLLQSRYRDTQDQETLLAFSLDKQTRNYGTECSSHYLSQAP